MCYLKNNDGRWVIVSNIFRKLQETGENIKYKIELLTHTYP